MNPTWWLVLPSSIHGPIFIYFYRPNRAGSLTLWPSSPLDPLPTSLELCMWNTNHAYKLPKSCNSYIFIYLLSLVQDKLLKIKQHHHYYDMTTITHIFVFEIPTFEFYFYFVAKGHRFKYILIKFHRQKLKLLPLQNII